LCVWMDWSALADDFRTFLVRGWQSWTGDFSGSGLSQQLRISGERLFELTDLVGFKPLVLLFPAIQGGLRDPHLTDLLRQRYPHFRLLQHRHDMFYRKPASCWRQTSFVRFAGN